MDAVASDGPVLRYMIARAFPTLRTVGAEYTDERFGIVLAKGSDDLRRAVNAALWHLQDSGEYATIFTTWFGAAADRQGGVVTASHAFDPGLVARTWPFFRARRVDDGRDRRRACCWRCPWGWRWRWRASGAIALSRFRRPPTWS